MRIYDISQELLGSVVFEGDPKPKTEQVASILEGDVCNLSTLFMCNHNGTHIDAPYHFINDGKTVEQIPLEKLVGYAYVVECQGEISKGQMEEILNKAKSLSPEASRRILIKGKATITEESAKVLAREKIFLVGNESQTVGPEKAPMSVHKILLNEEIVLLEGIRLEKVPEGVYILSSAPMNIKGADGASTRAILIEI